MTGTENSPETDEIKYIAKCKRTFAKALAAGGSRPVRVVLPAGPPPAVPGLYLVQQRLWDHAVEGRYDISDYPWRKLVACLMLNLTSWTQVDRVIWDYFDRWPDPEAASLADEAELRRLVTSLGLENKRAATLIRFSREYGSGLWHDPGCLHGVGLYAWHSWKIFVERDYSVRPTDGKLTEYADKVRLLMRNGGNVHVDEKTNNGPGG